MLNAIQHAKEVRARLWNPPLARKSTELEIITPTRMHERRLADATQRMRHPQWSSESSRREIEAGFIEAYRAKFIPVTFTGIAKLVCRHYGLSRDQLEMDRRSHDIVRPRQAVMYLAKKHTKNSLPEIGRMLSGMDHTTVLYGVRKMEKLIQADIRICAEIENFERDLRVWRPDATS